MANISKGRKKKLPEGWITGAFRYALFPNVEKQQLERSFGCERKVYNEYVAEFYKHLERTGFTGGFINYTIPSYKTIIERFDFLDKSNDAKMRFQGSYQKIQRNVCKKTDTIQKVGGQTK